MLDRIGALHLCYRVPGGGSIGNAVAPAIDRALQSGLADALSERVTATYGNDPAVTVVRELTARAVLGQNDWRLDSRIVDRICRASADALADALISGPDTESIVRFADQAEFVGSFIVDLLRGSAWDHWYYGAFGQHRRSSEAATIEAVLADNRTDVPRVIAWLARHGHLNDLIAVLGTETTRHIVVATSDPANPGPTRDEIAPLAAAAFRLLGTLGWHVSNDDARARYIARYLATAPIPPEWKDRRALSEWTLELLRFVATDLHRSRVPRSADQTETVEALLAGPLDWLDGDWLATQLVNLSTVVEHPGRSATQPPRRLLAARHNRVLSRIAEQVREGRFHVDPGTDRNTLIVRLVAAIGEEEPDERALDRSMLAAIERVVNAWYAVIAGAASLTNGRAAIGAVAAEPRDPQIAGDVELARHLEPLHVVGPAALALARALVAATHVPEGNREATDGAGLFLLTRALMDVRLAALARDADVPLAPLLGALGMKWLRLTPPFDGPVALWTGAKTPDFPALEAPGARLADLEETLMQLLADQRAVDTDIAGEAIERDAAALVAELPCSNSTGVAVARVAAMLLRAWARWLPGVRSASAPFVVEKCLLRPGCVRVSDGTIDVQLRPAPFDVVLEMAGYFRPIENVAWLDRRTIRFELQRASNA